MTQGITVEEAQAEILKHIQPLPIERVPILEALGRVVAEDVRASMDVPPFTNSAMDGYAVRSADTRGATRTTPVRLQVVGDVAAGQTPEVKVSSGCAVRIMTGAPMPPGADAVVRFEETSEAHGSAHRRGDNVEIYVEVAPGDNVRQAGEDMRAGEVVLPAGRVLRAQEIGVLAAMGYPEVAVHRRPRVAILATGDELVDVDEPISPGKIRNSNEYSTAALVMRDGGVPVRLGIARDNVADLRAKLRLGLEQGVDLFLTSAGVSVGDYDIVKEVLAQEGQIHFWQVRIKPGKPLAFGRLGDVPLIGLPGNPVAAMVAYEVFARPAILKMQGHRDLTPWTMRAVLQEDVTNSGRRHYMRAYVYPHQNGYAVTTRGSGVTVQGSGILTSMVWANCFVVVPEEVTFLPAGSEVEVQLLR